MKKRITLGLTLALCALALCVASASGMQTYESAENGLVFEYPDNWIVLGEDEMLTEAEIEEIAGTVGVDLATLQQSMLGVDVAFYDNDRAQDGFVPNMNVISSEAAGMTEALLATDEMSEQFKAAMESQMASAGAGLSWVTEPEAVQLGGRTVLRFVADYTVGDISTTAYQALVLHEDMSFMFTYSTLQGTLDADTEAMLDTLIGSVSFQ